jgi:hypothetical protein
MVNDTFQQLRDDVQLLEDDIAVQLYKLGMKYQIKITRVVIDSAVEELGKQVPVKYFIRLELSV